MLQELKTKNVEINFEELERLAGIGGSDAGVEIGTHSIGITTITKISVTLSSFLSCHSRC